VISELALRGLSVSRDPYGDTGFGTFVTRDATGLRGAGFSYPWLGAVAEVVPP
jgi:hypothetical protein